MRRRTLLGGAGLLGVGSAAGLGGWLYRKDPGFWRQMATDVKRTVPPAPERPDPKTWGNRGIYAAWLGQATVLLKIDGATILTDPVFSHRVGLGIGPVTIGIKRLVAVALERAALPKIDAILLSHAHFDHLDVPSLRQLEDRGTIVITAASTSDLLRTGRYGAVHELRWGEKAAAGPLEIRAFEVNHWGARMRSDTHRGYNGYTIESGRYRVLFGGDTAGTPLFRVLKGSRPFDLAIMPVGTYNPWIRFHCTPEQAWQMANDAGAEFFLPVHHQTFRLSREPSTEPMERLHEVAGRHRQRIALERIGQQFHVA